MKQRSSASAKTRYFRKDYAPARLAKAQKKLGRKITRTSATISKEVNQDLKKTEKVTAKVGKNLKQAAHKTSQTVKKASNSVKRSVQKNTKSSSTSTRQNRSAQKHKRMPLTWREITLISQIGASALIIAFTFAFCAINDPIRRSEQELAKLADAYYIEYLYPSSLGNKLYQPETVLKDYTKIGLPSVKLRQLLLYNNGEHADSLEVFSNPYYQCDTDRSYIRYYPVEPYGPRDYVVTYSSSCEKVGSN